jgi:hypothetical protein
MIKVSNIGLTAALLLASSLAMADGYWSNWLTNNHNGLERSVVRIQNSKVSQLQAREQPRYGIINLRLVGGTEVLPEITDWATTNQRGFIRSVALNNNEFATGIAVKEQWGHGVIDVRLLSNTNDSLWLTNNPNANTESSEECSPGYYLRAIQVNEQAGYGVVDVRFYCSR